MKLIGMLDSPFVRRVAISLQLLDLPFEHEALSVFSTFDEFHDINPVVKAPTLVCDDGQILLDSTLILEYAEHIAPPGRSLMPDYADTLRRDLRIIGFALAALPASAGFIDGAITMSSDFLPTGGAGLGDATAIDFIGDDFGVDDATADFAAAGIP